MFMKGQDELMRYDLSESIKKEMKQNKFEMDNLYFRNVHIFHLDSLIVNLLEHRLVPKHKAIRNKNEINEILEKCNCSINQLPIILKNDIISKILRLSTGDICEITRTSHKCGEYPFYRVCK